MSEKDDELTKLRNLLKGDMLHNDEKLQSIRDKYTTLTLPETNTKEPYEITITKVPRNCLVIRTDNDDRIPIKEKHADYCLIAKDQSGENWILYIELKKSGSKKEEVRKQLTGAKCLIEYCKIVMNEFGYDANFLSGFEERYVCISKNRAAQKRTTRIPNTSNTINNTARTYLQLNGDTVNFRQCIQEHQT